MYWIGSDSIRIHVFSKNTVVGFDINRPRAGWELSSGYDRTLELTSDEVKESIANGMVYSTNIDDIKIVMFIL